jgi:hypothetical protein
MSFRLLSALAAALACSLTTLPAHAAPRDRVFVASYGTDSGNTSCSFLQPCRTFQNAVNNVAAGGEVTAIDSADFGSINITQSVTITSPDGIEAGIAATGSGDAIDINGTFSAPVVIVLRGLTLEGNGTATSGVDFVNGFGEIEIIGCKIRNFSGAGISLAPNNGPTSALIKDSVISDNQEWGIGLFPVNGSLKAALDEVTINDNLTGIQSDLIGSNVPVELLISNSHLDNNRANALYMQGTPGGKISTAVLDNVTINQSPTAISLNGNALIWLSEVTQTTAPGFTSFAGLTFSGSNNTAYSDGTNHLMGGLGNGSAPVTLQSWAMQ